ncbi:hypothetical protein [Anoxybacter fermentans]|nr:hypothetical protein [Anoxybacter fermentans]
MGWLQILIQIVTLVVLILTVIEKAQNIAKNNRERKSPRYPRLKK